MNQMKDEVVKNGEALNQMARRFGEQAGSTIASASENAVEYLENGRRYVRANPVQSVTAAAVIGLAAGTLFTLAFRRSH